MQRDEKEDRRREDLEELFFELGHFQEQPARFTMERMS